MTVPDVAAKREEWKEKLPGLSADHLVFLDECGVNTDMTRRYGRAVGGERCVDDAPLNTPTTTTILSSIQLDGSTVSVTYRGGTTGQKFVQYLTDSLLPNLLPGDIVVMDNLRSHHVAQVRPLIEGAGCSLLYLPPYSPDFNPIEKLWSKIKAVLRKKKIRNVDALPPAISAAFSTVSSSNIRGWFHSCSIC